MPLNAINDIGMWSIHVKTCLNEFLYSRENVMQYPIRWPYNGLNLTVPVPLLPMEKGAVMKCTLYCPYMTVYPNGALS